MIPGLGHVEDGQRLRGLAGADQQRTHAALQRGHALLHDRLQVNLGRRQRYGSQLGQDEKERLVVISLESRERVDELRKALRMQPLKQYVDFFRTGTPPRVVVFEDDLE